jgi:hypothetical protein
MFLFAATTIIASTLVLAETQDAKPTWRRGNTHTHTLWSDGDAAPEFAIAWYVDNDYDFLVLSDHNVLQSGEKWFAITPEGRLTPAKVDGIRSTFGDTWPVVREREGATEMRLRTLPELKERFEKPGEFLLIPGEEVTDRYRLAEVHINAINLDKPVIPQHGESLQETIQNNIDAIRAQGQESGRPVLAHINHPNFMWSLTADGLAQMRGENFFEVYNGHRSTNNYGNQERPSTEQLWDIALSRRLLVGAGDGGMLYGLATDDAHNHHPGEEVSIPGRGWIMVRCAELTPGSIIEAMDRGDFYASSGVFLEDIVVDEKRIVVDIESEPGVTYVTEFIGTRRSDSGAGPIGEVLATSESDPAVYEFEGDELYVRARVRSSTPHPRPYQPGDPEMAWTQPHTNK